MLDGNPAEIDVEALAGMRRSARPHRILDVREPWEVAVCSFADSLSIPMAQLPASLARVPREEDLIVVCHYGIRSLRVMAWLRENGFHRATSLQGGIDAWARRIDPSMATY